MQIFGFLEKAQMENVSADLTNTLAGLVWFNTTDNKMRFYDNGAIRSVVDENSTQTLSDKTFTSGAISNFLDFAHQTTPASPTAGSISVYSKNDNKLYKLDSDGFEEEIGTGGGSGDINFCENPNAEKDIEGWNLYNDGAVEKPIDGTGAGGGTASLLFIRYDGAPLRGDASFLFRTGSSVTNAYGQGYSYDFTVDPADQANMVDVIFDYRVEDNYATGDYVAYVYDITNAKLIEFSDGTIEATTFKKTFRRSFQTAADSVEYRVIVHCAANDTLQRTFIFDDVKIAPTAPAVIGAPDVYLGELATTTSWTSGVGITGEYWRRGDKLLAKINIIGQGSPPAASLSLLLPSGLEMDLDKMNDRYMLSNSALTYLDNGNGFGQGRVRYAGASTLTAYFLDITLTTNSNYFSTITNTAPFTFIANDQIDITYEVPIKGWESGVTMSETESNRHIFCSGHISNDVNVPQNVFTTIPFDTVVSDTVGGLDTNTGIYTVPEDGVYEVNLCINWNSSSWTATTFALASVSAGGQYKYLNRVTSNLTGVRTLDCGGSAKYNLKKGDAISFTAYHSDAGTKVMADGSSSTYFSIEKSNTGSQTLAQSEKVFAEGSGNGSETLTVGVTPISFTETVDSHGAWSGNSFTAPKSGYFSITGMVRTTTTATMTLGAYVGSGFVKYLGSNENLAANHPFNGIIYLNKDEVFTLRSAEALTLSNIASVHHIVIHSL